MNEREKFMKFCIEKQMELGLDAEEAKENCEIHWDLKQDGTLEE